jgi:dipeptidyl aminopeptidase/acylaminoacyl peptidase
VVTSSRVACSVTLAGDGDLLVPLLDESEVQNFAGLLGGTPEERPERYEAASPAHNVDAETVPFLVVHGLNDATVDVQSARNLVDALTAAGREVTYAERPKTHGSLLSDDLTWGLIGLFLSHQLSPES